MIRFIKFIISSAILSTASLWALFYHFASGEGGDLIKGDLWESFFAGFRTVWIPFEVWEQPYQWPLNAFQIIFGLYLLVMLLTMTKGGREILWAFIVLVAYSSRRQLVVHIEDRREEFWNSSTQEIDYR